MSEPITRRRAATRLRLLDASVGVFAERGVLGGTVEEICDRAGFTRGAFYSNFASKDDLVLALFNRSGEENTDGLVRLVDEEMRNLLHGDRRQILAAAVQYFMDFQRTDRHYILLQAEIRLYAVREPTIRQAFLEYRQDFHREMAKALYLVQQVYGLTYSFPVEPAIEFIDPTYESCLLDAFSSTQGLGVEDLRDLPNGVLLGFLQPLLDFLDIWIVGIDPPAEFAEMSLT